MTLELTEAQAHLLRRIASGESPYSGSPGLSVEAIEEGLHTLYRVGLWYWQTVAYRALTLKGVGALAAYNAKQSQ